MSVNADYIAGFFDGEGCICFHRFGKARQVQLVIVFANTNKELLLEVQSCIGGIVRAKSTKCPHWKVCWELRLVGRKAYHFIHNIGPRLRIKAAQYQLASDFIEFMNDPSRLESFTRVPKGLTSTRVYYRRTQDAIDREDDFERQMHDLNRRGVEYGDN